MKQALSIFMLLIIIVASCTDAIGDSLELSDQQGALTKRDNHVRYCDIAKLNNVPTERSRNASDSTSVIECIVDATGDTLLYVYKDPEGGWTIYPSDSRVPPIVATSKDGSYENTKQNDGARLWIQSIAEDIALIKQLDDSQLNFTPEEIESNRDFWKSISSPNEIIQKRKSRSYDEDFGNVLDSFDIVYPGHYEYYKTVTNTEKYDSIASLTKTKWHQRTPYNHYCPIIERIFDNEKERRYCVPAGCVAIAGAQMLYFLHYHFGVPEKAPSRADVTGYITTIYTMSQSDYNSEIWDLMLSNGINAAPLVANVGQRLGTRYSIDGSGAFTSDLPNKVFSPYGISCKFDRYDVNKLQLNLTSGIPVIVQSESIIPGSRKTTSHTFIIDRYKRMRYITTTIYDWKYDNMTKPAIVPYVPPKYEYSYSSPIINMVGMNWGTVDEDCDQNEWFSVTGDWICAHNYPGYNWNISRNMVYDFEIKQP